MFDSLNKFQNASAVFDPAVLVAAGVFCVVVGIIVWLAGTKFTKIVAIVLGFTGGGTAAFHLFPAQAVPSAVLGAIVGAFVAVLIHRFITVVAGIAVFVIVGLTFAVGTHFNDQTAVAAPRNAKVISSTLRATQTVEQIGYHTADIGGNLLRLSLRLPFKTVSAFAIAIGVVSLVGMFFRRLMVALGCSSVGTAMIFVGMFSLLLYKGSAPLTYVYGRISFFFAVFAGMIVAGAVSQMILCRPPKLKIVKEHEKEIEKKKRNPGEHKWTVQRS